MANTIKLRRGTAAQWTSANSVLAAGEPGFETDTNKFKIGTGTASWNDLPYSAIDPSTASTIYAPLSSPSLTGTPLAPTAASGTNTTQIATTEFVRTAVSNLVDAAPSTLDTLNELAAALGDDANFSTTVTNSIATKLDAATASTLYLPISGSITFANVTSKPTTLSGYGITDAAPTASPSFTGTVALPSTTSIGNISPTELGYLDGVTSAIQTQLDSKLGSTISIKEITSSSYTLLLSDPGKIIEVNSGVSNRISIPNNTSVAIPVGSKIDIIQTGSGETRLYPETNVTLNSSSANRSINSQWSAISLVKRNTNTWVAVGALKATTPPSGFTLGSNGKYYRLYSSQTYTRATALSTAAADGGWLFVPLSSADRAAVITGFSYSSINLWMGFTFASNTQTINSTNHPLNGTTFSYSDWQPGYPAGEGVNVYASTSGWRDQASSTTTYGFIAEWY